MESHLKDHVTAKTTWIRGLYMLLFAIIYSVAEIVVVAVVIFQFLSTVITGRNNQQLLKLGRGLADFIKQVLLFVSYNSDEMPFPFGPWPEDKTAAIAAPRKKTAKKSSTKKKTSGDTD